MRASLVTGGSVCVSRVGTGTDRWLFFSETRDVGNFLPIAGLERLQSTSVQAKIVAEGDLPASSVESSRRRAPTMRSVSWLACLVATSKQSLTEQQATDQDRARHDAGDQIEE